METNWPTASGSVVTSARSVMLGNNRLRFLNHMRSFLGRVVACTFTLCSLLMQMVLLPRLDFVEFPLNLSL